MSSEGLDRVYAALLEFGLTPYEARVYLALSDGQPRTASEIVSLTGIPQPRVYSTLESLASKGLVEFILDKPKRYRAVDPRLALESLYEGVTARLVRNKELVQNVLSTYYGRYSGTPTVKLLKNRREIMRRARELVSNALSDVLAAGEPGFLGELIPAFTSLATQKPLRALGLVSYGKPPEQVQQIPTAVVRVREVPVIPVVIADSRVSLLIDDRQALEVTGPGLMRVFIDFFYHSLWRTSEALKNLELKDSEELVTTHLWLVYEAYRSCTGKLAVAVEGVERASGKSTSISGELSNFIDNGRGVRLSLLVDYQGRKLSVGGWGAYAEDIEGRLYRVKCLEK
ncbi:MAG: TrmB family transcriptional regulator sugar-binding domain-containing protein [Infirmifilum sp.]